MSEDSPLLFSESEDDVVSYHNSCSSDGDDICFEKISSIKSEIHLECSSSSEELEKKKKKEIDIIYATPSNYYINKKEPCLPLYTSKCENYVKSTTITQTNWRNEIARNLFKTESNSIVKSRKQNQWRSYTTLSHRFGPSTRIFRPLNIHNNI
jgi:hypothetical protein